jgi:hypothetical protein
MLSDEILYKISYSRKINAETFPALFTLRHILVGVGFTSLAVVVVGNGWISGVPQTREAREVDAPSAERFTEAPATFPPSLKQPDGQNDQREPSSATLARDRKEQATNGQAGQFFAPTAVPATPRWAVTFAQQDSQAHGAIISNGSIERHLTWTQIDLLDEIAQALPGSASDWLTIECAADEESRRFAKEILDVFSISQRIKALSVRPAEPVELGVFVTVSSQTDERFLYAQLIARALSAPDKPVHFGPPKDPMPGVVKIIILAAEPIPPSEQARMGGR